MDKQKKYKVYKYTSPSGKFYIGQTCQSLKGRAGFNGEGYKQSPKFYNAIKKYGFENFKSQILKNNLNLNQANYWESYFINFYNTTSDKNGYNLSSGGSSPIPSNETRQKMRQNKLGTKLSEETKQKIRQSHIGKTFTEQHKKKLSESAKNRKVSGMTGKTHTEETKKIIAKKNGKPVICIETGIIYESAAQAGRQLGIKSNHISECINNPSRYKTCGGYHWKKYIINQETYE